VLADNGSSDGSVEFVREHFPSIHIVENGRDLGYSCGMNAGLSYAAAHGADYFLVANDDIVIDRGALTALVQTAQTCERAGFVAGKVYFYSQPDTFQTVGKKADSLVLNGDHIGWMEKDVGQYECVAERVFVDDVATLIDRRVYDEVGAYDPQFFLQYADFDWQARAKPKGWRVYYTPHAKVWHRVSMSIGGFGSPIGRYFDTRSQMVTMVRYLDGVRFLRYYFFTAFRVSNSFLRGLVQFNWTKLKPRLAMLLGFIGGTFWLIHRQPATRVPWIIEKLS
jgi:GT2 family glycosyltransferase